MSDDVDYDDLPIDVKRVIQGVRGSEVQLHQLHYQHQKEVYELERKWAKRFQQYHDRRAALVNGAAAPTPDEINAGEKRSLELDDEYKRLPSLRGSARALAVQGYWLKVLNSGIETSSYITEADERALKSLTNIALVYPPNSRSPEFVLEFHFARNNYFNNSVLRLAFIYKDKIDMEGDFEFSHVTGDNIQWKPRQSLVKPQKKQSYNGDDDDDDDGSFFEIFSPPALIARPERPGNNYDDDDMDRELELDRAFEFGLSIKHSVLARSTDYYVGDADDLDGDLDDDDDNDWGDDDDENDNDDDDDDDDDDGPRRYR